MKLIAIFAAILATSLIAADNGATAYIDHDKVAKALKEGGPLVSGSDYRVSGSHRDKAGVAELHDKETDIMYVTEGSATLITGGTMIGDKITKPDQHTGSGIQGGQSHHLTKGDVIVVPAGTPHWFKEVPQSIDYFVVKVVRP